MMTVDLWRQGEINPLSLTRAAIVDLGFGGLIEKIEEYFGRRFTQALIGFICFVLLTWGLELFIGMVLKIDSMAASTSTIESVFGIILTVVLYAALGVVVGKLVTASSKRILDKAAGMIKESNEFLAEQRVELRKEVLAEKERFEKWEAQLERYVIRRSHFRDSQAFRFLIQGAGWVRRPARMARAYSLDLRERVISAVSRDGMSCRAAARHFGIGESTAVAWLARYRRTGSAAPGRMGGYKPRAIRGAHERWLRDRVARGDFTLHGLVGELAERGLKVDYRSVWTFVHEQGLSFKKNAGGWRASAP